MNNIRKLATAISFILGGALLRETGIVLNSYAGTAVALTGLIFLIIGLRRLKDNLSEENRSGPKLLLTALYLGIVANLIDYIPFIGGLISGLFGLIILILELLGYFRLAKAPIISNRSHGVGFLIAAIFIGILANIITWVPGIRIGGYIDGFFLILSSIFFVLGWTKLLGALIEGSSSTTAQIDTSSKPISIKSTSTKAETNNLFD